MSLFDQPQMDTGLWGDIWERSGAWGIDDDYRTLEFLLPETDKLEGLSEGLEASMDDGDDGISAEIGMTG